MGYSGDYTLLYRCISECIGTFMFIFLLETMLANKLLPKTKGHDVGFGWVAVGAGFAVFLPVQFFGYISTAVNPAMALGSAITGFINWYDWPAIALSELIGAMLGAALVWVYYLPHFKTVPEPPPKRESERLLRTRDDIGRSALNYASYNSRPYSPFRVSDGLQSLRSYLLPDGQRARAFRDSEILGKDAVKGRRGLARRKSLNVEDLYGRLRNGLRRTLGTRSKSMKPDSFPGLGYVSLDDCEPNTPHDNEPQAEHEHEYEQEQEHGDVHTAININLQDQDSSKQKSPKRDLSTASLNAIQEHNSNQAMYFCPSRGTSEVSESPYQSGLADYRPPILASVTGISQTPPEVSTAFGSALSLNRDPAVRLTRDSAMTMNKGSGEVEPIPSRNPTTKLKRKVWFCKSSRLRSIRRSRSNLGGGEFDAGDLDTAHAGKLYEASKIADQNAKLAVFCTRPAVYSLASNLITEMVATVFLVLGILFINQRAGMMYEGERHLYVHGIKSLYVGLLIMVLVLSLGGPGVAMNPARDLGPRLVHWMLPIAGKGSSEWHYGWIPVVGPFMGGIIGGLLYILLDKLNQSNVNGGYYEHMPGNEL